MTGAWHGGKGPDRRREDTAKVEANWPKDWNARERGAEHVAPHPGCRFCEAGEILLGDALWGAIVGG